MIILRQKNYSINYKQLFPRVSDNLFLDIEGTLPENIVKSILTDYKNTIVSNIWKYEKDYATKSGLREKDFVDGLILFAVSYDNFENILSLSFGPDKNTKLSNVYSCDFFWDLEFSGKDGRTTGKRKRKGTYTTSSLPLPSLWD